jgi:LysM domain
LDQPTANIVIAIITAVLGPVVVLLVTQGNVVAAVVIIMVAVVPIALLLVSRWRESGNGGADGGANGPRTGAKGGIYTVKDGDTFNKIAQDHEIPLDVLKRANPQIPDHDSIFPGDKVRIPRQSPPLRDT